ncbi:MAG: PSD1 domain-containing protein [Planctomycetes bacterium]|nr:PSD1 domain-containing protein [Planctomycetota bacterium]
MHLYQNWDRSTAHVSILCAILTLLVVDSVRSDDAPISFNRDIRPILSNNCYACHGPDEQQRKAKLRFDRRDGVFSPPSGSPVIFPGDPDKSVMVFRITHPNDDVRMPPPDQKYQLTQEQIALLSRWIEQGATWERHWVYMPPQRPAIPNIKNGAWVQNEIDSFVQARLEAEGLKPSPEAEKRVLIRRLSFDLTGLPPTTAAVDDYLRDESPKAYEKVVDRLLGSASYGERMAMSWLDLVRYADTSGYHSDENISVWPYRDYVIRAFNDNMRYDRFTRENLAGDLLPNATPEQRVASAFNRLNQTTAEGGAQAKEYLAIYAADRVRAVSTVWMGATLGCAQCHDHKFDPYTTKDFYSLAAFFADVTEPGVYRGRSKWEPVVMLPSEEQQANLQEIDVQLERLQGLYESPSAELETDRRTWERETLSHLDSLQPADLVLIDDEEDHGGKTLGEWRLIGQADGPVLSGKHARIQSTKEDETIQHGFDRSTRKIRLMAGDTFFATVWMDPINPPQTIMLQWNDGDWEHRAFWGQDKVSYGGIGEDTPGHRPMGALPAVGEWIRLEVKPGRVGLRPGSLVKGMALTQFGGTAYWDEAGIATTEQSNARRANPKEVLEALQVAESVRTKDQRQRIDAHFRAMTPKLASIRREKDEWQAKRAAAQKEIPYCLTTVSTQPRPMRVLPRGNWMDDSGDPVQSNTPGFLPPLKNVNLRRATRLDLANWLISEENPMTSRAFVNRVWAIFFGRGLSKVLDDLGSRGEWPIHLELLDWLAVEFMETDWNVKHLVKLIVTSGTYRQSSKPTAALREEDPYNRLLARQSRRRLDAEMIRDHALSVSGLLVDRIGGKSVKPYQPAGYYANLNFPKRTYQHDSGENQYRRGLYTHWQRTFLHPSLMAFDAPSRQECTAQRSISNTPIQALTLLNDPSYVEAAMVFAALIMKEAGPSTVDRIAWAYRETLGRRPMPDELQLLTTLYTKHLDNYASDERAAKALGAVGQGSTQEDIHPSELAAWTSVARVLFNLHEGITRY